MLTVVALIAGMQVGGNGVDLFGLYVLALIFNQVGLLWACGVAMRFRSVQAGPLMQTPVFLVLFLAPVYVPLSLLQGWIHGVARLNPLTFLLEAGRGFIEGEPTQVGAAFAVAAGCSRLRRLGAARAPHRRARRRVVHGPPTGGGGSSSSLDSTYQKSLWKLLTMPMKKTNKAIKSAALLALALADGAGAALAGNDLVASGLSTPKTVMGKIISAG